MVEDVYEPLASYRDEFRRRFSALVQAEFKNLARRSGVNVSANRRIVAQIDRLSERSTSLSTWQALWAALATLAFAAALCLGFAAYGLFPKNEWTICFALVLISVAAGVMFVMFWQGLSRQASDVSRAIAARKRVGWEQMKPLNRLISWDVATRLMEKTVPRLEFDPYFTAARLRQLRSEYGWTDDFFGDRDCSVVFSQSGTINGNPFVIGECVVQDWEMHTYTGTRTISWAETERDAEGRPQRVPHFDVLSASVERPRPFYKSRKFLVYGNDAAPNLSFSRRPSDLSADEKGFFANLRLKQEIERLKEFSRNLDDEYPFTLMSNHEFEALFHATDRSDEVEFRLLFTALAQTQMLQLLRDRKVGYGDDFLFEKSGRLNLILSKHLRDVTLSTDPEQLRDWNFDRAARTFREFNEKYFKDVYFALAPLLAIPLYQRMRPQKTVRKGRAGDEASFWEDEATANYLGEEHFRAPDSDTRSILKAKTERRADGEREVSVTAYGFRMRKRVEHESVFGGDGRFHDVAVEWMQYVPVSRTRTMVVAERPTDDFARSARESERFAVRRSIAAYVR